MTTLKEPLLTQFSLFQPTSNIYTLQANSYKSYDSTTGKILNCYYPQKGPMEISLSGSYSVATAPSNISQYQNLAKGACNLNNFPKATYPEVYESFEKEYEIFQKLYVNNLSGNLTSADLVPTIGTNVISCSGNGYTPYTLEYFLSFDYARYVRFCATQNQINQLQFTTIGDYSIYDYIDNNTKLPCKSSSCSTEYPSFLGHSLNSNPIISNTPNKDNRNNLTYILAGVGGGLLLLIIIFLLVYLYKKDKKIKNN